MIVTFERGIGRTHEVEPLELDDELDADAIAEAVYRYARPFLRSREVEVYVDLEHGRGGVLVGGFRPVGPFTIATAPTN